MLPEFVCLHGFPSAGAWGPSCDRGFLQDLQESGSYGRVSAEEVHHLLFIRAESRLAPGPPTPRLPCILLAAEAPLGLSLEVEGPTGDMIDALPSPGRQVPLDRVR